MKDITKHEDVKLLVDAFYADVKNDALLGPIFNERIQDWQPHLERMYSFWSTILLGDSSYRGQPFAKHISLPIQQHHFQRWTELFEATALRHFNGPVAEEAIKRGKIMASLFLHKLTDQKHHLA